MYIRIKNAPNIPLNYVHQATQTSQAAKYWRKATNKKCTKHPTALPTSNNTNISCIQNRKKIHNAVHPNYVTVFFGWMRAVPSWPASLARFTGDRRSCWYGKTIVLWHNDLRWSVVICGDLRYSAHYYWPPVWDTWTQRLYRLKVCAWSLLCWIISGKVRFHILQVCTAQMGESLPNWTAILFLTLLLTLTLTPIWWQSNTVVFPRTKKLWRWIAIT